MPELWFGKVANSILEDKLELLEVQDIVYMASPLQFEPHTESHAQLITWLSIYGALTPYTRISDRPTLRRESDR